MLEALSTDDVQAALDGFGLGLSVVHYAESTKTSQDAAAAIGCSVGQIAKSICLLLDEQHPLLVVASGEQRVDDKKVAALHEVGRKKIRLANAEECLRLYGYAPGGVPPIGHRSPLQRIWLDSTLHQYSAIYAAAGSANSIVALTPAQLAHITGGTWADVVKESSSA